MYGSQRPDVCHTLEETQQAVRDKWWWGQKAHILHVGHEERWQAEPLLLLLLGSLFHAVIELGTLPRI